MENQHATHPRMMHPPSNRGPPTNFARGSPRGLPREPPLPIDEMNRLRSLMTKFQQQQSQKQQQQQRQNRSHQQQRHLQPGTHPALPRHGQQPRARPRGYPRPHGMQPFPHGPRGPAPPLALSPAQFPGAASLVSQLDKKVLVWLWEGRREKGHKLVGYFRSFDRYANTNPANFVLQNAFRRKYHGRYFCEEPLGLYIVRGDSVLLIGELDVREDEEQKKQFQVSESVFKRLEAGESIEAIEKSQTKQQKQVQQTKDAPAAALGPD